MDIVLHEKFSQFQLFEANVTFTDGEKARIFIERRRLWNDKEICFTKVKDKDYRRRWFYELAKAIEDISFLSIIHNVFFINSGKIIKGKIIEEIWPERKEGDEYKEYFRYIFNYDNEVFTSDYSQTFQDAYWDWCDYLGSSTGEKYKILACYSCKYAGHATPLGSDRIFWCYRDIPEADFDILQTKRKQAPSEILFSGRYYVDGFHYCAAWEEINLSN